MGLTRDLRYEIKKLMNEKVRLKSLECHTLLLVKHFITAMRRIAPQPTKKQDFSMRLIHEGFAQREPWELGRNKFLGCVKLPGSGGTLRITPFKPFFGIEGVCSHDSEIFS